MNRMVARMPAQEIDAADQELRDWKWDGDDLQAILDRLALIEQQCPEMLQDWGHTVPVPGHARVTYDEYCNTVHSGSSLRSCQVLAADKRGMALVRIDHYNPCNDTFGDHIFAQRLSDAMVMMDLATMRRDDQRKELSVACLDAEQD